MRERPVSARASPARYAACAARRRAAASGAGAATGFEAAGRRVVDLADRLLKLAAQVAVDLAPDLGARIGMGGGPAGGTERQRGKEKLRPGRQTEPFVLAGDRPARAGADRAGGQ